MALRNTVAAHSGKPVKLMELDARFGITCAAVTKAGLHCTGKAVFVTEAKAPVCGTHTEPGQKIDYEQVKAWA